MGKKKASKARRLRPILENAIARGEVYCSLIVNPRVVDINDNIIENDEKESYHVVFGSDASPYDAYWKNGSMHNVGDHVCVYVSVYADGSIKFYFDGDRDHVLDRKHSEWFVDQLEQIITMHKMGAYESQQDAKARVDYSINPRIGYYKSKRSWIKIDLWQNSLHHVLSNK